MPKGRLSDLLICGATVATLLAPAAESFAQQGYGGPSSEPLPAYQPPASAGQTYENSGYQGQYAPPNAPQSYPQQQGYPQNGYPQNGYSQGSYPPGSYPQGGYPQGEAAGYSVQAQQADRDYAARYSAWAAQYCVSQRNNNTAAGALIGGILGAVVGAGIGGASGSAGTGAAIGGGLGVVTGAAVGSSSTPGGCPPGYVVHAGAPAFAYQGAYYGPPAGYPGAIPYQPWVWTGGRWVYYPYRSWYYAHPAYWRPAWQPRPYPYHY